MLDCKISDRQIGIANCQSSQLIKDQGACFEPRMLWNICARLKGMLCNLDFCILTVLPSLIPLTTGIDLYVRHGALLATAEVTHAIYKYAVENNRLVYAVINLVMEKLSSTVSLSWPYSVEGMIDCTCKNADLDLINQSLKQGRGHRIFDLFPVVFFLCTIMGRRTWRGGVTTYLVWISGLGC